MISGASACAAVGAALPIVALAICNREGTSVPRSRSIDEDSEPSMPRLSVNFHFTRTCNYECRFCFHTDTKSASSDVEEGKRAIQLLYDAGMRKINFSGGEPFLFPKQLGEYVRFCKETFGPQFSVTIVSNGSKMTDEWLEEFGHFVDYIAISCDSFDDDTCTEMGRVERGRSGNQSAVTHRAAHLIRKHNIELRINTVVTALNKDEDMNAQIATLQPARWKVFQMLLVTGENWGDDAANGRDATDLVITDSEYAEFLKMHEKQSSLVAESNDDMRNSYIIMDEKLRLLDCSGGGKEPTDSILRIGAVAALEQINFDGAAFERRKGYYQWLRNAPTSGGAGCSTSSGGVVDIEELGSR